MAGYRFNLDLFIPEDIFASIPLDKKQAFRDKVRDIKAFAVKINKGQPTEEATIKAVFHKCYHDENINKPCDPEQEI